MSAGALEGLTVIEVGGGVAAAFCTRVLADLGATVIKVEPPGGDPLWHAGPLAPARADSERGGLPLALDAGKRNITLDLTDTSARHRLSALLAGADLYVENGPEVSARFADLRYQALRQANPSLVVLSLSPYGMTGPWGGQTAADLHVCAVSGVSIVLGEPQRTPLHLPHSVPSMLAGAEGAAAALAALRGAAHSGVGQHIDVAAADCLAFCAGSMALYVEALGAQWQRRGLDRHGPIYPSGYYPCKDGYIILHTQSRRQWSAFLQLMGNPEWARNDPQLQDGVAIGFARADEVDLHFIPWLVQHTRAELLAMAKGNGIVVAPLQTVAECVASEQLHARRFWGDVNGVRVPGFPCRMSASPWRVGPAVRRDAPQPPPDPLLGKEGEDQASLLAKEEELRPPSLPRRGQGGGYAPFAGVRAIEFGWNWAGPVVGMLLADLGAEVIRVESRSRLDFMRHWDHARPFFANANRGKRSVTVDAKLPDGRQLIHRLAAKSDIVFDNFAADVMCRLGLGYEPLRAARPDLIVLSMAMAGQDGPLSHLRGFATAATGFVGLELAIGYPDSGPVGGPFFPLGDLCAAVYSVIALAAALRHRERTGEGQFIDLSQVEAAATLMTEAIVDLQLTGRVPGPNGNHHSRLAPHGIYPSNEADRWVALAVRDDAEWQRLRVALGDPAWAQDADLATASGRVVRADELDEHLAGWTRTLPRDEIVACLMAAGIAAAPVLEMREILAHPHFTARELHASLATGEGETLRFFQTPWKLSATPARATGRVPALGEGNAEILRDRLGLPADEYDRLVAERVIY